MEVITRDGQQGFKDIYIKNQNKLFSMFFMGNGDLYWTINKTNENSIKEIFDIPKVEKDIYELFDKLYENISSSKIFEDEKYNNNLKYIMLETNLFNVDTKTIKWHSDETYFDSDDIVKIVKQKDNYHLEFTRPEVYEDPYHLGSPNMISIRFRNSGSYYKPFNIAFMDMFKDAQSLQERGFENLQKQSSKTKSDIER